MRRVLGLWLAIHLVACAATVTPVPPEGPEGVLPESRALEIVRSAKQIGSVHVEVSCATGARLLLAPSGSLVPDLSVACRYPSWVVLAHGSFRVRHTAQVTELADAAWIFVDAGSGEPYGVRFNASPSCFGLSAGKCKPSDRLRRAFPSGCRPTSR